MVVEYETACSHLGRIETTQTHCKEEWIIILKVHPMALSSPARPHVQMVTPPPPMALLVEAKCLNSEPVKSVRYLDLQQKKDKYDLKRKILNGQEK